MSTSLLFIIYNFPNKSYINHYLLDSPLMKNIRCIFFVLKLFKVLCLDFIGKTKQLVFSF